MHEEQHHHSQTQKGRPLAIAIGLNLLITIAQVVGGVISGSLALLGDALHNFSDVLSLIISYVANKLSHRDHDLNKTFGFKRAQILAAFINALTLIGVSVYLIFEAIGRIFSAQPILSEYVIWLAFVGILVNGGSALLLIKMQKGDSNMRAAYLHLLGDLATSVAVLIGGIAMYFYDVFWIDGAITIAVSVYLIGLATKLFWHTTRVLMQFVPSNLNVAEICERLRKEPGVCDVHHVHVWRLNDDEIHLEAHVLLNADLLISDFEQLNHRLAHILADDFNIGHVVLQPEFKGCSDQRLVAQE